ncbi:MAG: YfhO family protein [Lachnospiraceae bacterium]|nr:YfhO family protein [Lachnospiraceae bacterium]
MGRRRHQNQTGGGFFVFLPYTILYLLLAALLFALFRLQGKSLVYQADGWRQHLRALSYYGKYLRGALRHLILDHSLIPQTWAPDIGYGSDVITTLQYYCLGDPLAALSVFVPTSKTLYLYEFLIFLRPYLAGSAFLIYAGVRGETRPGPVLTGALLYAFSGTVLYTGMLHPYFINPMIDFPLLLSGVELALKKPPEGVAGGRPAGRRFIPFVLLVALSAMTNFYFFYMLAIFTAAYGVARLLQLHGLTGLRGGRLLLAVFSDVLCFIGAAGIGVMIAGLILLPVIFQFLGDPRAGVEFTRHALYERDYYRQLPLNLVSWINHPMYDTELCFALPFVPLALILLFRRGHRTLKICLALTVLLLLFPAVGSFLNGFSYTINRWTFTAAMLAGWICVRAVSDLTDTSDKKGSAAVSRVVSVLLPALTTAGIAWNILYGFSPSFRAFPSEFLDHMDSEAWIAAATDNEVSAVAALGGQEDHDFYRYSGRNLNWNAAMASGLSSTQFAFSFANGTVSDYFQSIGINDEQNFAYFALDDRMIASSLAGVRYYTLAYDNYYEYRFIPYDFIDRGMVGNFHVYENPNALPLGFVMDRVMRRSEWETLSLTEREEALLQAAVLEDKKAEMSLPGSVSEYTAAEAAADAVCFEVPFTLSCGEGVTFSDNRFTVRDGDRTATLTFDGAADAETMLQITGLVTSGTDSVCNLLFSVFENGEYYLDKTLSYKTPDIQYYSNWHDFVINFGSTGDKKTGIRIDFPSDGTYSFEQMSVVCRPMDAFPDRLKSLAVRSLGEMDLHENPISHATGTITGEIASGEDAVLLLTLPYTPGFRVFVDNQKTPVTQTDVMFLSVPISAGTHDIRIEYRTPGLLAGAICSLFGIALLLWLAGVLRFRRT